MFNLEDLKGLFERKPNMPIDPQSFYAILEGIPVSVVISDATADDFPILYTNKVFELVTGYTNDEVVGKNCRFLQGPNTDQAVTLKIRKALYDGVPINVVFKNYKKDGTEFTNELIIVPIYIAGVKTFFIAIQNDLNRRTYKESVIAEV